MNPSPLDIYNTCAATATGSSNPRFIVWKRPPHTFTLCPPGLSLCLLYNTPGRGIFIPKHPTTPHAYGHATPLPLGFQVNIHLVTRGTSNTPHYEPFSCCARALSALLGKDPPVLLGAPARLYNANRKTSSSCCAAISLLADAQPRLALQ